MGVWLAKERGHKKNGIMWGKFPNWGAGGLTQTHFLMSI